MKLAVMQPYFFPYIGYWQMIHAVDTFVIYDDVTFIKQGYINRNNIIVNNQKYLFTLEAIGASSYKLINEIKTGKNKTKIKKTICQNYKKASYFEKNYPIIEEILDDDEENLAIYVGNSLKKISNYLDINTNFIYSSDVKNDKQLHAEDKVINICTHLKATTYINSIGGLQLYDKETFKKNGINLLFLNPEITSYLQFTNKFISHLSIIDLLMFNSKEHVRDMITRYSLI